MLRFLAVIVTWFHSSGGLPHQSADWFAMTGYFEAKTFKQQFVALLSNSDRCKKDTGISPRGHPGHRAWLFGAVPCSAYFQEVKNGKEI